MVALLNHLYLMFSYSCLSIYLIPESQLWHQVGGLFYSWAYGILPLRSCWKFLILNYYLSKEKFGSFCFRNLSFRSHFPLHLLYFSDDLYWSSWFIPKKVLHFQYQEILSVLLFHTSIQLLYHLFSKGLCKSYYYISYYAIYQECSQSLIQGSWYL